MSTKLFIDNWLFAKTQLTEDLEHCNFSDVELPHDFLIYDSLNLYESCIGWYKKEFSIDNLDTKNEKYFIRFDGVYQDSTVYLNGEFIGEWKYGYSTFEFDLTKHIKEENTLIVKVVHQSPNSRWYSGAGIYRNVYFKRKNKNHFITDSLYIHTEKQENNDWKVNLDASLSGFNASNTVEFSLVYKDEVVLTHTASASEYVKELITVNNPKIWDIDSPENIYTLVATLKDGENILDTQSTPIGFRDIVYDYDNGMLLNGRRIELNGVCQHHDLGGLGSAINKKALKRQMQTLKDMGVNAIRTSHNMPAKEVMELADEMGILICSEGLDMWELPKTEFDYARFFYDWVEKDYKSWIERDRNHPSLIMWSIGNEILDTCVTDKGLDITIMLNDIVKKYDYYKNAVPTIGSNFMLWERAPRCTDILKFAGYNYADQLYEPHHNEHKDWFVYGSETSSVVQSRGIYHFPLKKPILSDDDEQCSSLGNSTASWGAKSMESCIIKHRNIPYLLGQFLWTGTDYIGEPIPYNTKSAYFGQVDTAGFRKDSFYFYQAEWTSYKTNPMVHIFPYWDFSLGQIIDVRVTSNAPKVELFLNDKSLGVEEIDHINGEVLVPTWSIPYEIGTLKAVAYDENNNVIATDIQTSFTDPAEISLLPSDTEILANGVDLTFIEINMLDKMGNVVQNAKNRVEITVSGCGRLVALDNGDSTDYDQYKGSSRRLFSGKLLAMVAPTYESGDIVVTATSEGLPTKTVTIRAVEVENIEAKQFLDCNYVSEPNNEVPVRKIELILEKNTLDENNTRTTVVAKIFPENATYRDLEWRLTNDIGITSTIANFEVLESNKILITGLSDGEFYVRCSTKNGGEVINLYSHIEVRISGLGDNFFNPYNYISAGLYSRSNVELPAGNERGIATQHIVPSHVIFDNVDFGDFGTDTFSIDIFALDHEQFTIELWEGDPAVSSAIKITDVVYTQGHEWNVFKKQTFKLPYRLKGVKTFTFVLHTRHMIRGFIFEKQEKAYQQLFVSKDKDSIYGDTFTIEENCVANIGNNVNIGFRNMDFTSKPASKVTVHGQTPNEINTIQVRFTDATETKITELQFTKSTDFKTMTFDIPEVKGKYDVDFIFLPGSNFSFEWFKFE